MRLLTHNQLVCVKKGCDFAFPLQLSLRQVEQNDTEVNAELIMHLIGRVDYEVLKSAAEALNIITLPEQLPAVLNAEEHAELIAQLHTLLLDIHVTQGDLICPVCKYAYPIQAGIPNMRLDESEL